MEKQIVNTEENDTLNATADVRNYGAGTEAGHLDQLDEDENDNEDDVEDDEVMENAGDDQPMPDELSEPEEADDDNQLP